MKKITRHICIVLTMLLLMSLFVGCTPSETTTTQGTTTQGTTTQGTATQGTTTAPEPAFDKLDISLFTGGYTTLWDDMVVLFKEFYPDVEVTADLSNDNAIRVRARILAGDPPDVATTSGQDFDPWEAAASGLYMPLDDFFATGETADGRKLSDILNPSILNDGKVNGVLYLPTIMTAYGGWWYDAAQFRENNWNVPATWEEFNELAPKIKEAGVAPFIHQGSKAINYIIWGFLYEAVAAAGGYEAFEDAFLKLEEGSWTSDAMLQAATWLYELEEKGYMYEGVAGIEFTQAQIEFINGNAAMIPCGSWFENEMADVTPENFEMAFMPLPLTDSNGVHYLCSFAGQLGCPANSKNPEAAKAWLGVIYSKEGQKLVAKYGQTPVATDVTTDDIADYITPTWATVIETAARGDIAFVNNLAENWYAKMWPDLQDNITNLGMMEITPEEFCNNMEEIVKGIREDDSIPKYYSGG